jgi:hypothetical protein
MRNGAVERMEREPRRRSVRELQRGLFDAFERAFRDEPDTVDERITRHAAIVQGGVGRVGLVGRVRGRIIGRLCRIT